VVEEAVAAAEAEEEQAAVRAMDSTARALARAVALSMDARWLTVNRNA